MNDLSPLRRLYGPHTAANTRRRVDAAALRWARLHALLWGHTWDRSRRFQRWTAKRYRRAGEQLGRRLGGGE